MLLFDSHQQMKRAYDQARGRFMLITVFIWLYIMYLAMVSGRRLRDAGYSLPEESRQQIAAWQEKGRQEREAEMKKSDA